MRLLRFAPLLALLLVLGCDSNDGPPEIGGTYTASETDEGVTSSFRMILPSTDSGTFTLGTGSQVTANFPDRTLIFPVEGTGRYDFPNISVTFRVTFDGGVQETETTGTVSASGDTLTLQDDEGVTLIFTRS